MPDWSVAVVAPPAEEPVGLDEARAHLRAEGLPDGALVEALIGAAREWCEHHAGRAFVTQTLRLRLRRFPPGRAIELPRAPAQSVAAVSYADPAGGESVLAPASYLLSGDAAPPRLSLAAGASWPATRDEADAVAITYTAGYGPAGQVPRPIRQAILLLVGEMYARREDAVVGTIVAAAHLGAERLLAPYRIHHA